MIGKSSSFRTENLGETKDRDQCALLVFTQHPTATGVTFQTSNKNCFAEFGTKGGNGQSGFETCKFNRNYLCFLLSYSSLTSRIPSKIKYFFESLTTVDGDDKAVSKWFWCCSAARKYNDPDNLFIPQGSLYPSWGNMQPDDIDKWKNKGCDAVVGGSTKPNCRIGLYHFNFGRKI